MITPKAMLPVCVGPTTVSPEPAYLDIHRGGGLLPTRLRRSKIQKRKPIKLVSG